MARRKKSGAGTASASSSDHAGRGSRSKRSKPPKFSAYVYKVLKQVHPELSMTNKAMKVMDDFMHDIYTRLVEEAAGLVKFSKKSTLSASEFQTATRLILPGELAKHAVSDATKAVASFMRSRMSDAAEANVRRGKQSRIDAPGRAEIPIEIEILHPVGEVEPVAKPVDAAETKNGPSKKRKATEDAELETEPVASTSTPRKSPAKRPVPTERRSAIDALEALETPHKEDNKLPDESEGEAEDEEERAPPTPPTEEESDESYQSLPGADESAAEVEEREASNVSEADTGAGELQNTGDAVDVGATLATEEPTSQINNEDQQPQPPQEQPDKVIEDVSTKTIEKPTDEQPSASSVVQEPIEEANTSEGEAVPSSEEIATDKATDKATDEATDEGTDKATDEANDKATQGTETDLENVTMDTESSLESEDPLISVRVQVHRGGHPDMTSNISLFDRTAEGANQGANQQAIDESVEADTSTNENNANLDNSLVESQPSILSEDSDMATFTRCYTASAECSESERKTVVTVKCSKVTTTKTVVTHERRERVSEWVTEKED